MNPYGYTSDDPDFNMHLKETTRKWLHYTVDFPTAHPTQYEENNTVMGEYFQPRQSGPAPLAILVHGMGDSSTIPCKLMARSLVGKGISCFMPYLVFHTKRMPDDIKNRLSVLTAEEWFEGYQISVIDVRQIVDWAGSRKEINREQIATVGISFGGIVSSIAMGVDERIKAGVFIVSGGNSEKMMWLSRSRVFKKRYNRTEAEYNEFQHIYAQYLAEVANKGFENVESPRKAFLNDPMTFAYSLRERPLLMVNALWDEFMPKEAVLDFWEACGRPALAWYPANHAGIWLWYPLIRRKIASFLTSTFGGQGRHSM